MRPKTGWILKGKNIKVESFEERKSARIDDFFIVEILKSYSNL